MFNYATAHAFLMEKEKRLNVGLVSIVHHGKTTEPELVAIESGPWLRLSEFYVYKTQVEEKSILQLKGLGRFLLCHTLQYLVTSGVIKESDRLCLEASGGQCSEAMIKEYRLMSSNEMKRSLVDLMYMIEEEKDDLAELACIEAQNQLLVTYYQKLGFEKLRQRGINDTLMQARVNDILAIFAQWKWNS